MNINDIMNRLGGIPLRVKKDGTINPEDLASLGPAMDRVLEKMGVSTDKRDAKKNHAIALLTRPGGVEDALGAMKLTEKIEAFEKLFASLKADVDEFVAKASQRPGASPKLVVDLGETAGMMTIAGGILSVASTSIQHAITCGCNNGKHSQDDDSERPTEPEASEVKA